MIDPQPLVALPFTPADVEEYAVGVGLAGGEPRRWFSTLAARCLLRYLAANQGPGVPAQPVEEACLRVWDIVSRTGWLVPLPAGATKSAEDRVLSDLETWVEDVSKLIFVAGEMTQEQQNIVLAALRQLFKTCLYAEFTVCRESYRQLTSGGVCKRQQLSSARARLSGSPCVDCPYTVLLRGEEHVRLMREGWAQSNSISFDLEPMCFLPEDFRGLRRFLWLYARSRENTL